jgi:hypothetical protein
MDRAMIIYGGIKEWVIPAAELAALALSAIAGVIFWGKDE